MAKNEKIDFYSMVIDFYSLLDDEVINIIFYNFYEHINRKARRVIQKMKPIKQQIKFIFSDSNLREVFADAAYLTIKDGISLDLFTANYDDIISFMDEARNDKRLCICYTIFFFRWCYVDNNDERFLDFLKSNEFLFILSAMNGSSKNTDANSDIEKSELHSLNKNFKNANLENNTEDTNTLNSDKAEANSMRLYGRIEKRNTYYNFFPQYKDENGTLVAISQSELEELYPERGAINLAWTTYYSKSKKELDKLGTDNSESKLVVNLYEVNVNDDILVTNDDSTYKVKIDIENLLKNNIKLNSVIRNINESNIYKVVTPEDQNISLNDFGNSSIYLSENNLIDGEAVLLEFQNKYYGPFMVKNRAIDNKFYVKAEANAHNFLVSYYNKGLEEIAFVKQDSYYESSYYESSFTRCAKIHGNPKFEDVVPDYLLIEKLNDVVDLQLACGNFEEFCRLCTNSPFISDVSDDIKNSRIERVKKLLLSAEGFEAEKKNLFKALIETFKDADSAALVDGIVKEREIYKTLEKENDDLSKEVEKLQKENSQLKENSTTFSNSQSLNISKDDIDRLSSEKESLEKEVNELKAEKKLIGNIDTLNDQIKELETTKKIRNDDVNELNEQINDLKKQKSSAKKEALKAVTNGLEDTAGKAFDPYLSNLMLKAAAEWDSNEESENYTNIIEDVSKHESNEHADTDLVDYLVDFVQKRRNYKKNDILNIYISIAQNFLTVFSGEPGIGKTSICKIIADSLGLNSFGDSKMNRYVPVSVERGWTTKRDLIGYFNPLTKKYDKSNGKIYDALMVLNKEGNKSTYPYLIMLDEANLSPMEYYWADFMRLTEVRTEHNSDDFYINIGTEEDLYVPETLRFLATINTDQTTEQLSPRLIDRACIIKLPNDVPVKEYNGDAEKNLLPVKFSNILNIFAKQTDVNESISNVLDNIFSLCRNCNMSISPRIQIAIKNYIAAAQKNMEYETGVQAKEKALDYAILQKILPKINGYYDSYKTFFEKLTQICDENHLYMTKKAIDDIKNMQEQNMGYCQYLI